MTSALLGLPALLAMPALGRTSSAAASRLHCVRAFL